MSENHYAAEWIARGYYPVPIPYREKGPVLENWQNLRVTADLVSKYWNGQPQNCGVLLGLDGNCDIDLDSAEAVAAFPFFAPDTGLIFGRAGKPRSHWFYRIDPPCRSMKYLDPVNHATLLEFRCLKRDGSVGLQTVVPRSVHPSGELVDFAPGCAGNPENVDAEALGRAVRWTAAAALLARHWPPKQGGRHDAFLALSGALANARWDPTDATRFVQALYQLLWPGDADLHAAAREVEDTFRRWDDGHEVTGIPSLTRLVPLPVVRCVLDWLRLKTEPKEKLREEKPVLDLAAAVPSIWALRGEVQWLIEGLISEGSVNLITGDSGDGKSTLALALAGAVARGTEFLGRRCLQRHVLYVDRENPLFTVKERLLRLHIAETDQLHMWGGWCGDLNPEGPDSASVIQFARRYRPLIVFDPLICFLQGDENDALLTRRHMTLHRNLAGLGATVVILHHTGKSDGAKECRGSSDIKAAADSAFLLERADGSESGSRLEGLRLKPFKLRLMAIDPIRLTYADGDFASSEAPIRTPEEIIHDGLRLNPGCTQQELITWTGRRGLAVNRTRDLMDKLVIEGKVLKRKGRHNTIRYYLPDAGPQLVEE